MKRLQGKLAIIIVATLVLTVAGGCSAQKKPLPPRPGPVPPDRVPRIQVKPTPQKPIAVSRDSAADINGKAESIHGVKKAHTVVVGNAAVIGIETTTTTNVGTVRDRVVKKWDCPKRGSSLLSGLGKWQVYPCD
ncbi:MAG: hypothetical protein ACYC21_01355 [Eubacteriales bacterium]